jgi:hypothetical protein
MLARTGNAGRHPLADRGSDLYETPPCAVRALIDAEPLPHVIWEPACGRGSIARVLKAASHVVHASDLCAYGYGVPNIDFLASRTAPEGCQCILTNPPYKDAEAFVERAISLAPKVVMLLRLAFLESTRRTVLLEQSGLASVHVFRNRIPMMHRDGWDGPRATSTTAYAWFVWQRGYGGKPEINRISWRVE